MIRTLIRRLFAWLTQPLYYDPEDPLEEYWSRRREERDLTEPDRPGPRDQQNATEARDEPGDTEAQDKDNDDPSAQRSPEIPQNRRYPSSRSGRGAKR